MAKRPICKDCKIQMVLTDTHERTGEKTYNCPDCGLLN